MLSIVFVQLEPQKLAAIRSGEVAVKHGTILNGDAVGTKVSVRHRQGGHSSEEGVKRGSTAFTHFG